MPELVIRQLGQQPYLPIWQAMQDFTNQRQPDTPDEIWLVEHTPVFTQGQAGKAEHILASSNIPIVQVDRGGQVTYHGPGQQMMYVLINLKRYKLSVRDLVTALEQCIIRTLNDYGIKAYPKADAPGVYIDEKKICSIGLRIRKGCSFHGLALNVNMDLQPFQQINPCGYAGLQMTDCAKEGGPTTLLEASGKITRHLTELIDIAQIRETEGFNE